MAMNPAPARLPRVALILAGILTPFALLPSQDWEETESPEAPHADEAEVEEEEPPAETDSASRKILGNYVRAMGGMDAIKEITSYRASGTVKMGRNENEIRLMRKAPRCSRYEVDHEMRYRQTGTVVRATDGDYAWTRDGRKEDARPKPMGKAKTKDFNREADFYGPLIDWEEKGITFRYEGKDRLGKRPVYILKAHHPDGAREWFYFDAKSFILLRHKGEGAFANARQMIDTTYTGYRKLGDTYFPTTRVLSLRGQELGRTTFEKVEPNVPLDDSLFEASKPKEVWIRQRG